MIKKSYKSINTKDTKKIANEFAKNIKPNDTVALIGNLGAGKTFFIKKIGEYLGFDPLQITSPGFTLVNIYQNENYNFVHADLYRVNNDYEIDGLDLLNLVENPFIFVEWADKMNKDEFKFFFNWQIIFEISGKTKRDILIEKLK